MIGAAGAMGVLSEADVLDRPALDNGERYGDALAATGWAGSADPAGLRDAEAYFEAHIEQGPTLEAEGLDIGMAVGADHHRVDHPAQHHGGVLDGLAAPELHIGPAQVNGMAPELKHPYLK